MNDESATQVNNEILTTTTNDKMSLISRAVTNENKNMTNRQKEFILQQFQATRIDTGP